MSRLSIAQWTEINKDSASEAIKEERKCKRRETVKKYMQNKKYKKIYPLIYIQYNMPHYQPINSNVLISYTITPKMEKKYYPIQEDNTIRMSDTDFLMFSSFRKDWTFKDACRTEEFRIILFSRIGSDGTLNTATLREVSHDILGELKNYIGCEVILEEPFSGDKPDFNPISKEIHAIILFNKIKGVFMPNNTVKPLGNYIELEFPLPENLYDKKVIDILKDKTDGEVLDYLKHSVGFVPTTSYQAKVSAVSDNVVDILEEDTVRFIPFFFDWSQIARIDVKNKKVYFLLDSKLVNGILKYKEKESEEATV